MSIVKLKSLKSLLSGFLLVWLPSLTAQELNSPAFLITELYEELYTSKTKSFDFIRQIEVSLAEKGTLPSIEIQYLSARLKYDALYENENCDSTTERMEKLVRSEKNFNLSPYLAEALWVRLLCKDFSSISIDKVDQKLLEQLMAANNEWSKLGACTFFFRFSDNLEKKGCLEIDSLFEGNEFGVGFSEAIYLLTRLNYYSDIKSHRAPKEYKDIFETMNKRGIALDPVQNFIVDILTFEYLLKSNSEKEAREFNEYIQKLYLRNNVETGHKFGEVVQSLIRKYGK
ncbi:MAG: hypothetical protein OQJ89_02800 [Kangiellaceae bacterium]|nr:hypothetical protein [Kangiellaceae bacterium]MCW9000920.1 hypothetical protein [Kangiellaceae bacterium]MCW9015874.1 hypothetical protein [Kangiellaceae bacterium]